MRANRSWLSAILLQAVVHAQSFPANTNTNCGTSSDIDYQATYIYLPSDDQNFAFYTQSTGTCDSGSYARVHAVTPEGNDIFCDYVALDGSLHLVQCPNLIRGTMPEGQYALYWETVPGVGQFSWNQFTVSHAQQTSTAAAPTSTVTTTPTTTATQVSTTTSTDTFTSQQSTVTLPSSTVTNTILVTPTPTTTISTTTRTFTRVVVTWSKTVKTTSYPTLCQQKPLVPCKKGRGRGRKREPSVELTNELVPRRVNGVGMMGEPATTTVTPVAVVTTSTAAASTTTVTVTSQATPNASVTVANPTPTTTVYSGSGVVDTTSTLPQETRTSTKRTQTVKTNTLVFTVTVTKATPYVGPCRQR